MRQSKMDTPISDETGAELYRRVFELRALAEQLGSFAGTDNSIYSAMRDVADICSAELDALICAEHGEDYEGEKYTEV